MSRFDSQCSSEDVNKEDECLPSSSEDSQDGTSTPMENDDEPEFSQKHYDIEPCYYSLTGKSDRGCRGIVYRYRKDSDLKGFQSHDGTLYRLRDSVFVEVSQNEPYVIAAVCGFKYTKRDHVVVKLTRYFRADDIPELSLNLMKQERAELEIQPNLCPQSLSRELFNSELQITQPVSCLRGKCIVEYVKDIRHARAVADFSIDNDTFFFCLHYNQDSTKLASTHYAIRVGTAFQATLPPVATCSVGDEKDRDELLYRPNSIEVDEEEDYIKLARCYRTFTLSGNHMLDSQKNARYLQVSDLLMDEAIIQLHRSGYKIDDALSELNANDIILTTDVDYMTQDDAKKFAKGIKQLGKNFSRIHRELLPHHSREQLVSYYYLWKKTPEATKPKQAARRVNPASIKRPTKEKVKASRPTSTEYLDFDSASESDVENNGPSGRACHHCYVAESKDWHHANGLLLCTDCRLHYKKYGQLRSVVNRPTTVPACLFKRSNSDEEESGVRTRAGKKEQRKRTPSSMSETPDRRSPSTNGASHLGPEDTPTKKLNGNAKRVPKRPLHNGALNGDKINSSDPSSPTTPPPTLTNGLTNGHAPETSTPNGESVTKKMKMEQIDEDSDDEVGKMTIDEGDDEPMPVLNGFKKEESVEEIKLEVNGDLQAESDIGQTTSCSVSENGADNGVASVSLEANDESNAEATIEPGTGDMEDDDESFVPDDITETFKEGTEVEIVSQNANFVRAIVRSCGPRCARTDLYYKIKKGSKWDKLRTERDEKEKNKVHRTNHEAEARLLGQSQQFHVKKEQHAHIQAQHQAQQQHHQAQQNAQQHMQLQQLQQAMMMNQMQPELLRMMPQQFAVDPTGTLLMQQMMNQNPGINVAALQQIALQQQMEQAQQAQIMRIHQEIAHHQHQKMIEQQRNAQAQAAAAREREQQRERERERLQQQQAQQAQQAHLQQQQQQQAANAAQMPPQLMQIMQMLMAQNQNMTQQDLQKFAEITAVQVQQAQHQAQQQAQREQEERERKEREAREREARERREREQAAREQAAREQAAREQAAREAQAAQQQQAAAAAAAAQQSMNMDQQQMLLMQHLMLNPTLLMQMQQQHGQAPLQLMQQAMAAQGAAGAEMMRRLQPESAVRPQHQ